MEDFADKIVNLILFPFGRCRVRLDDWPANEAAQVIDRIKTGGGVPDGEGGMPGFAEYYFRLQGCRIRLTVVEYGESYLWGPKFLVRQLTSAEAA